MNNFMFLIGQGHTKRFKVTSVNSLPLHNFRMVGGTSIVISLQVSVSNQDDVSQTTFRSFHLRVLGGSAVSTSARGARIDRLSPLLRGFDTGSGYSVVCEKV